MLDLEPSGDNDTVFNDYKALMDSVKTAIGSQKDTAVAAPSYGTNSVWFWSPVYYYYMGGHVDLMTAMTYDSGITNAGAYQSWMTAQTTNILRAVSGEYWNDTNHPPNSYSLKIFTGMPAYPKSAVHYPQAENITNAASGVRAGLTSLAGNIATNYFYGADVYLQTDGSGTDGYAGWTTDWYDFYYYWLPY